MSSVEWFKKISYKPEVELSFNDDGHFCELSISRFVLDARGKKDRIVIAAKHREMSVRFKDEEHFIVWVYQHLKSFELHEFEEWFEIDGRPFMNPHRDEVYR